MGIFDRLVQKATNKMEADIYKQRFEEAIHKFIKENPELRPYTVTKDDVEQITHMLYNQDPNLSIEGANDFTNKIQTPFIIK